MKVIEHLNSRNKPFVSLEIIPPKRGANIEDFHSAMETIVPYDIPYINVTSHAADIEWIEMPDGNFKKKVCRKSPGTFGLCAVIKYKFNIDPVPHLLCAGFTREETEDALIELNYLGIENILAIRGDGKVRHAGRDDKTINRFASDLISQLSDMNKGTYQDSCVDKAPTNFCVGASAYPEKHFEAPNVQFDVDMLKKKQDLGAAYAVTQMFFDNRVYFDFVDRARDAGVTIPIIPGLKILSSKKHVTLIPRTFHANLPEELTSKLLGTTSRTQAREIGVDWCYRQAMELYEKGSKSIHLYIMQNSRNFTSLMDILKPQIDSS